MRPNLAGSAGASPRGEGRVRQGDRRPPSRPSRHVPHGRREVREPPQHLDGRRRRACGGALDLILDATRAASSGGGSRAETEPIAQPRSAGARERPRHAKAHSGRHGDRARRLLLHRHRVRHLGQRDLRLHALRCSASGARVLTRSRASSRLTYRFVQAWGLGSLSERPVWTPCGRTPKTSMTSSGGAGNRIAQTLSVKRPRATAKSR